MHVSVSTTPSSRRSPRSSAVSTSWLPVPEELDALAADLRVAAEETRRLPATVPMDALGLFRGPRDGDATDPVAGRRRRGRRRRVQPGMSIAEPLRTTTRDVSAVPTLSDQALPTGRARRSAITGSAPVSGGSTRPSPRRSCSASRSMTPGPWRGRSRDVSGSRRRPMSSPWSAEPASGSRACSTRSPDRPVSDASARRPTTAHPLAWVPRSSRPDLGGLLGWLGIPDHEVRDHAEETLGNVAILDLPDLNSIEEEHRQRVEAILPRVDAVVWVTDPEKYHDAILHDDFLATLAASAGAAGGRAQQDRPPLERRRHPRPARPRT